ncbi:MAG: hypothetical protein J6A61_01390 [Clostridia bacterium]|nr:hypothetical protein [Clostridia bacterium]
MSKKILCILLFATMLVALLPLAAFADTSTLLSVEDLRKEYGAITVEAYNIGHGFVVEPSLFLKEGKSVGDITAEVLTQKNMKYKGSTAYFSGFEFDDTMEAQYPEYLLPYSPGFDGIGDGNGYLEEFDYSSSAGWCFTINDWWASWGADNSYPEGTVTDYNTGSDIVLGDVIRWHFSLYGYGTDCGFSSNAMAEWMGGNLFLQEDKSNLIFLLAALNDYYGNLDTDTVYETARSVAANPLATASEIGEQETVLTNYIEDTFFSAATSEYEIIGYDEESVFITFPEEGIAVTIILADYENDKLNFTKPIPVTTKKTNQNNVMAVPIDSDITLSSNDKIMLWEDFTTCMPLCEAYLVN